MAVKRKGAAATAAQKKKNDGPRYCVYLGPSIRGVIQYGTIINGTHNEASKEKADVIARFPTVRNLIIQDADLPEARIKIKTPGNALYEYNRKLIAALEAGE